MGSVVVVPSPLSAATIGINPPSPSVSVMTVVEPASDFTFDFFAGFDLGAADFLSDDDFFAEVFFLVVVELVGFAVVAVTFVVAFVVAFVVSLVVALVVA